MGDDISPQSFVDSNETLLPTPMNIVTESGRSTQLVRFPQLKRDSYHHHFMSNSINCTIFRMFIRMRKSFSIFIFPCYQPTMTIQNIMKKRKEYVE